MARRFNPTAIERPTAPARAAGPRFVLYRLYGTGGDLLYIGASSGVAMRLTDHSITQPWWDDVAEIKLERFSSFGELAKAEAEAIFNEDPRHNVVSTGRPLASARRPRAPKGEGSLYRRTDGMWVGRIELPSQDGRRRCKYVSSRDRDTAERKFRQMKAELARGCD